jgi:hypothetical protein
MNAAFVFVALLAFGVGASAQDDAQAAGKAQLARIQQLREQRPGDGILVYYEALTRVQLGQKDEAIAQLRTLLGRHLGIVPVRAIGFDAAWDDPAFQSVVRELGDDEVRTPDSPVALRLSDTKLVPEGIAYDPKRRMHFLSSMAQHKIVAVDSRGQQRDFSSASDSLDAVLGLAVDAKRDRLCAVSTNGFEDSARKARRNAIVCYSIAKAQLESRVDVADAAQLNDLALAPDGGWYMTDSQSGTLYRIAPGAREATKVGDTGMLRGANGVAVSPEGIVYAGISTGIARIDPRTMDVARMVQPDSAVTGGIDGLYWHRGALYGIQNVSNPGRVIRVDLADAGKRISGVQVLQSHRHSEFDEPTTGVIVGDTLHVIANSHAGHYQPDGSLRDAHQMKGTAVLAVPLRR